MNILKQLGCVFTLGISTCVFAVPVTFDFSENRNYSSTGHSFVGSDGSSVVDVTPYAEYGTPYLASYEGAGLAIYTCTPFDRGCANDDNTHQIDGMGPKEAAVLDFGEMVNLVSATFSFATYNDDFTLLSGGMDGAVVIDDQNIDGFFATFNFGSDVIGEQFAFLADHWSDDFKLYSVTADYVSNVPEPASLSLLGLGLVALGSMRRKAR